MGHLVPFRTKITAAKLSVGPQRSLDFGYTLFGQLVRGFPVLTNINTTVTDANSRPLADEIIQTASYVTNTSDTVITLTATNLAGITGTVTLTAVDGAGNRTTQVFHVTTATDTNDNHLAFYYGNTLTNLVAPRGASLTNNLNAFDLAGDQLYWYVQFADENSYTNASGSHDLLANSYLKTLTYNVTNVDGQMKLFVVPATNYAGPVNVTFYASDNSSFSTYCEETLNFAFGDTPIAGQSNVLLAGAAAPFVNLPLATFTNGVAGSAATNFTATINWGDNSTNSGIVTASASGQKAVLGSHTYAWPGSYPVYVQVQSAIGATTTILSFINVTNQASLPNAQFTVQVSGQGTVSPDYNNASLVVGDTYTVSASPAAGWVFSSWTDGHGFVLGASNSLAFTLSAGLSLTANFTPVAPPVLTIVSPSAGQVITNLYSSPAAFSGTVADNVTVTGVWYQVNAGGWQPAAGATNWTASFAPAYGLTNVLQAYAVNQYGAASATNTVRAKYLAGAVVTLNTNGPGVISPNLSNQLLPAGTNYTLTATPAAGFGFAGWTGGLTTNTASLKFTLTTNLSLTANFMDLTKPVVTVSNLVNGQSVSNRLLTVTGRVTDNYHLASVEYQLNSGGWTNVTGLTNWSAALNLTPGANLFQIYATDATGTRSLTNTLTITYVVSAPLQLAVTGLGTLTPNYSNALLQVGKSYTITAVPAAGFVFSNWTGSFATNKAALTFTMASNLSFTANFKDVTPPSIAITNLVSGQRVTNGQFTVLGKATDNWRLGGVQYQLNNGGWTNANGGSNWSATVSLTPGTNYFQAYAYDTSGNHSPTNAAYIDSVVLAQLSLQASGSGTITPNYSNQWLEVGRNYTMKAAPAAGWVFYNWLDGNYNTLTNNATLTFSMSSGLSLTANFHQPPTISVGPSNTLAFYHGGTTFSVVAGGTGPLAYQWQFNSVNLSFQNGTNLVLSSLAAANAGSYRVIVNSYSQSVTSSVAKLSLTNVPTSLAGLNLMVAPENDYPFQLSFGTNTFSQFPLDTNYENSVAGGYYGFAASGALTGQLSLTNQVPPDAVSNGTESVEITFVRPGWAVFTNDGGSGTIQYYTATNLAPKSWSGHTITITSPYPVVTGVLTNTFKLTSVNDFTGSNYAGTYTAANFSPVADWLQLIVTGEVSGGGSGGVVIGYPGPSPDYYLELEFTTATSGSYQLENYIDPGTTPLEVQRGSFTWQ